MIWVAVSHPLVLHTTKHMPIYEYICSECGLEFEHLARLTSEKPPSCPGCGASGPEKQLSSFAPSVAAPAAPACGDCRANPVCPAAGAGRCPGAGPG